MQQTSSQQPQEQLQQQQQQNQQQQQSQQQMQQVLKGRQTYRFLFYSWTVGFPLLIWNFKFAQQQCGVMHLLLLFYHQT